MQLGAADIEEAVRRALAEDVGSGDVTTEAVVAAGLACSAELVLEEPAVVCGVPLAAAVFRALDGAARLDPIVSEAEPVERVPAVVARVTGPARAILTGERTALNFVGRLSGIATLARAYADAVAGTGATILDTRKTTPGLRALEKYAVRCGGATNHRLGLHDGVLVKENHVRLANGIATAVARARAGGRGLPVEVEVETLAEVVQALEAGADRVLLDNMGVFELRQAVELARGRAALEASGGITLENVRAIAETGVDFVSIGALTHSARAVSLSLDVAPSATRA